MHQAIGATNNICLWAILLFPGLFASALIVLRGFDLGSFRHGDEVSRLPDNNVPSESRRSFTRDTVLGTAAVVTTLCGGGDDIKAVVARQPQYETAMDIPDEALKTHQILYGYVERVIDGDTIRIRHIPEYLLWQGNEIDLSLIANSNKPVGNSTIVVRLYGVDAPETAKKKSEISQPFGDEAKQFTKDLVLQKVVTVKLIRRDRYQRIIGEVSTFASTASPGMFSPPRDLSLELASRGLATIYKGGGAEYDGKLDILKEKVKEAQLEKLGIWSLGDEMVTPSEFKRLKKAETPS